MYLSVGSSAKKGWLPPSADLVSRRLLKFARRAFVDQVVLHPGLFSGAVQLFANAFTETTSSTRDTRIEIISVLGRHRDNVSTNALVGIWTKSASISGFLIPGDVATRNADKPMKARTPKQMWS